MNYKYIVNLGRKDEKTFSSAKSAYDYYKEIGGVDIHVKYFDGSIVRWL